MKISMRKITAVALLACFACLLLTGCKEKAAYEEADAETKISVTVKIEKGTELLLEEVTVKANKPVAAMATVAALKFKNISYSEDNGLYGDFAGYASTETEGWVLSVNGKVAEQAAGECLLQDGDSVEWRYVTYHENPAKDAA